MTDAVVRLWGRDIGAVSWVDARQLGVFQYLPEFVASGIAIAPLTMPPSNEPYEFPALPRESFKGLPGLLADSLPDRFGNALIDAWLAAQGRSPESFNPVERLCYVGVRGMGALEFQPALTKRGPRSTALDVAALVELANRVLAERAGLHGTLQGDKSGTSTGEEDHAAIEDMLRVGTSAGGARAKAILAWNETTGEFRSGQLPAAEGFTYWLMKFDGIVNNRDKELADPQGWGLVEYGYHLMAVAAGIEMMPCRLHHEGGRSHFMTRRFDRTAEGHKLHMQSLAALRHFDFNAAGAHSYEEALQTIRLLELPAAALEQQFRRGVFNVLARNQDDHVKNIAFLMERSGAWRLSPAFDLSYAHNPVGQWTSRHQMSLNGKLDGFDHADLVQFGATAGLRQRRSGEVIEEIAAQLRRWPQFAAQAGVPAPLAARIGPAHRQV